MTNQVKTRLRRALLGLAGLAAMAGVAAPAQAQLISRNPALFEQNANDFQRRVVAAMNGYRAQMRVPALRWDARLAASARAYGPRLASLGTLVHSPRAGRPGVAETLWQGPRGEYPVEAMVGYWAEQRRLFRPGIFPNVSTTGDWADVAHYSQIIWPTTTQVGCALQRGGRSDYLICHFAPKGNRDGVRVP